MLKLPFPLNWLGEFFMAQEWLNMLLVAGSTRNIGKTSFICQLLQRVRNHAPIAIKISPHFHAPTQGLKVLSENEHYQLFEETNQNSTKDSSRYLQSGALRSFYIQVTDELLPDAFMALLPFLTSTNPILIESAALHKHVAAGLFVFIYNQDATSKPATHANKQIADFIIQSDGKSFSIKPEQFNFNKTWTINQ